VAEGVGYPADGVDSGSDMIRTLPGSGGSGSSTTKLSGSGPSGLAVGYVLGDDVPCVG